mmetsp:Transcript_16453/g.49543  ORF Transcript_16453/g.49543 Transcript_16453/m.49543 type:complete len:216 (+) Transcript_16453:221-868(+)
MSPSDQSGCASLILARSEPPKKMKADDLPLGALGSFLAFFFFFAGGASSAGRFFGLDAFFSGLGSLCSFFFFFFFSGLGASSSSPESSPSPSSSPPPPLPSSPSSESESLSSSSPFLGATKSSSTDSSSFESWMPPMAGSSSDESPGSPRPMAWRRACVSAAAVSWRFRILRPLAVRNSSRPLYSVRSMDEKRCSGPPPRVWTRTSKFFVADDWP